MNLENRIRRLEEAAPADDDQALRLAAIPRERRKALCAERGEVFRDLPVRQLPPGISNIGEVLSGAGRNCRRSGS